MITIGVLFGGNSREREVSFAGGRTVFDNLNRNLFQIIPVFLDAWNNPIILDWKNIYKGTIRDFYPPAHMVPKQEQAFNPHADQLNWKKEEIQQAANSIGTLSSWEEIAEKIDLAFLSLHGKNGEDGRIQALLELFHIPYTGSGILGSAFGMDKARQRIQMNDSGFDCPSTIMIDKLQWDDIRGQDQDELLLVDWINKEVGFPAVVKPAKQGSSIGVSVIHSAQHIEEIGASIDLAFGRKTILASHWNSLSDSEKQNWIKHLTDVKSDLGLPLATTHSILNTPSDVVDFLNSSFESEETVKLQALDSDSTVLIEEFIEGKEFSCVVLQTPEGDVYGLPPTEIIKKEAVYDYRSKYLPGLARKTTPIEIEEEVLHQIRLKACELFEFGGFEVYARIDGFVNTNGEIFLNDPNTTSGMMPSSFFFHQAAEIGLNPSDFLTYIIHLSLLNRVKSTPEEISWAQLLDQFESDLEQIQSEGESEKVAVIFGGSSSERHISVESGRNIFEKLNSAKQYQASPIFLIDHGNSNFQFFKLPPALLLKDNADDIKHAIEEGVQAEALSTIRADFAGITHQYALNFNGYLAKEISLEELPKEFSKAFIALHGRPGEDGQLQQEFERLGFPFNGSPSSSAQLTINKYQTNQKLISEGLHTAKQMLIAKSDYLNNWKGIQESVLQFSSYPLIAKPVDDGCSSAVKLIKSDIDLHTYLKLLFRDNANGQEALRKALQIPLSEEIPMKSEVLLEELVSAKKAKHFLEVTGGMLISERNKQLNFEVFEPSEALVGSEILTLEEKFLAGQGTNITPARFSNDITEQERISEYVKQQLQKAAEIAGVRGYCRIDAFVSIFDNGDIDVSIIEINSLPGMTPATCIFHQAAIANYTPSEFIHAILDNARN